MGRGSYPVSIEQVVGINFRETWVNRNCAPLHPAASSSASTPRVNQSQKRDSKKSSSGLDRSSTYHQVVARHTAVGQGNLPAAAAHRPEEVAAADRTGHRVEAHHTGPVPAEAGRTVRPGEARHTGLDLGEVDRTGLAGEHRTAGPGEVRRIGPEEVRRRTGRREERRSRQVRGWSSRPWSHSCGQWHQGGA
jgi:hypothetical protein